MGRQEKKTDPRHGVCETFEKFQLITRTRGGKTYRAGTEKPRRYFVNTILYLFMVIGAGSRKEYLIIRLWFISKNITVKNYYKELNDLKAEYYGEN